MNHDILNEALNEISDTKLAEAADARPRHRLGWISTVAAALALAIALGALLPHLSAPGQADNFANSLQENPLTAQARLAVPRYPQMSPYPDESKYMESNDWDAFNLEYNAWREDILAQRDQPQGYADSLSACFSASIPALLRECENSNTVCSPLNIYMALAMLAEITDGTSRQQILDALNAPSPEALRALAGQVWNAHYLDDGASATVLANSLWLDEGIRFNADTVRTLADGYYASVFQGDLGSDGMNGLLQDWLNTQTRGLLQEQAQNMALEPETVLALASTICYRAKWTTRFSESKNTEDIFHSPSGEMTATFLHRTMNTGSYFWGADFSATYLTLEDGSKMWLILPDEGYTPADILESGEALALPLSRDYSSSENVVCIKINLSLPKFDVSGEPDLKSSLEALGITDVFRQDTADFSPILSDVNGPCWLDSISHAARVKIDEEGVEAAAYTVMSVTGNAMPPEDEVDFTLDRPFLFVITSHDNLPLFAGVVNEP